MSLREWFDSEDVIAGISLPMIQMLTGRSPRFRDFLMGFLNQIIARNAVALTGGGMNPVTLHSVKSLLAGALVPLEDYLWRKKSVQSEGVFRSMSKATVTSDCWCRWFYHRRHSTRLSLKKKPLLLR